MGASTHPPPPPPVAAPEESIRAAYIRLAKARLRPPAGLGAWRLAVAGGDAAATTAARRRRPISAPCRSATPTATAAATPARRCRGSKGSKRRTRVRLGRPSPPPRGGRPRRAPPRLSRPERAPLERTRASLRRRVLGPRAGPDWREHVWWQAGPSPCLPRHRARPTAARRGRRRGPGPRPAVLMDAGRRSRYDLQLLHLLSAEARARRPPPPPPPPPRSARAGGLARRGPRAEPAARARLAPQGAARPRRGSMRPRPRRAPSSPPPRGTPPRAAGVREPL
jgi:hypothetical protein